MPWVVSRTGFGGIVETSSSYSQQDRHSMYTQQVGYGSVSEWCPHCRCRYCHHTFMCHKCHVKHISKQYNFYMWQMARQAYIQAMQTIPCAQDGYSDVPVCCTYTPSVWLPSSYFHMSQSSYHKNHLKRTPKQHN